MYCIVKSALQCTILVLHPDDYLLAATARHSKPKLIVILLSLCSLTLIPHHFNVFLFISILSCISLSSSL